MSADAFANMPVEEIHRLERRARFLWTGGIIVFFSIQAVIWTVAIIYTHNDMSHAIIPDYDKRALAWDDYQADLQSSNQLGWTSHVSAFADGADASRMKLFIDLRDRQARPLGEARISIVAFHCARAAEKYNLTLQEQETGTYVAVLPVSRRGEWQIEITAQRGDDRYLKTGRIRIAGL